MFVLFLDLSNKSDFHRLSSICSHGHVWLFENQQFLYVRWLSCCFFYSTACQINYLTWRFVPSQMGFWTKEMRSSLKKSDSALKKKIMHNIQQHVDVYISEQEKGVCALWKEILFSSPLWIIHNYIYGRVVGYMVSHDPKMLRTAVKMHMKLCII